MHALNINFDRHVAKAINDLPGTFILKRTGQELTGAIQQVRLGEEADDLAGTRDTADFMIVINTSVFNDRDERPVYGDEITDLVQFEGRRFRVTDVATDEPDASITMFITDITG